jgi:hypothetical protein
MFQIFSKLISVKDVKNLYDYYKTYNDVLDDIKKKDFKKIVDRNVLKRYKKNLNYYYNINFEREDNDEKLKNEIFIFKLYERINRKLEKNIFQIINDILFDEWDDFVNSTNENIFKIFLKLKKKSDKSNLLTVLIGKVLFQNLEIFNTEKFIITIYFALLKEQSLHRLKIDLNKFEKSYQRLFRTEKFKIYYKRYRTLEKTTNFLESKKTDIIPSLIKKNFKSLKSVLINQYLKNEKRLFFVQIFLYCLKQIKNDEEKVKEILSFSRQTGILIPYDTTYSLIQTSLLQRTNDELIILLRKNYRHQYVRTIQKKELIEVDKILINLEKQFNILLFEEKKTRQMYHYSINLLFLYLNDKFKELTSIIFDLKVYNELMKFKNDSLKKLDDIKHIIPFGFNPKTFLDIFDLDDFKKIYNLFVKKYPEDLSDKFKSIKDNFLTPYVKKILLEEYAKPMMSYYISKKFKEQWILNYEYILNMFTYHFFNFFENFKHQKEIIHEDIKQYNFFVEESKNYPIFEEYKIDIKKKISDDKKKLCDDIETLPNNNFGYIHFFKENELIVQDILNGLEKCLYYKIKDEIWGGYKEIRLNYEVFKSTIGLLKNFPSIPKDKIIIKLVEGPYIQKIFHPYKKTIFEDNIPFILKDLPFEEKDPFWLWFLENENSDKFNHNIIIILKDKPFINVDAINKLIKILETKFELTDDEIVKMDIVEIVKMYKTKVISSSFFKINKYDKFIKNIWEEEEKEKVEKIKIEEKEII